MFLQAQSRSFLESQEGDLCHWGASQLQEGGDGFERRRMGSTWVSSMTTLFSGWIHGVGLYILVISSAFFWHSTARIDELRKQDKWYQQVFCLWVWNSRWKLLQDRWACWKTQAYSMFRNHAISTLHASVSSFSPVSTGMNANFSQNVIGVFLQRDFRQELKVWFILEQSSVLGDGQLVCKGKEPTMDVRRRAPSTPLVRGGTMAVVIERFKQWRCIIDVLLIPTLAFFGIIDSANCSCVVCIGGLLLYPNKTFLWKGFLIHGRNAADD